MPLTKNIRGRSESVGQYHHPMDFKNDSVSRTVIGKAMEVHRELGPGIKEEFYHRLYHPDELSVV